MTRGDGCGMTLHRAGQAGAEPLLRKVGFAALRVNGSMRDKLLNKTLFLKLAHSRVEISA